MRYEVYGASNQYKSEIYLHWKHYLHRKICYRFADISTMIAHIQLVFLISSSFYFIKSNIPPRHTLPYSCGRPVCISSHFFTWSLTLFSFLYHSPLVLQNFCLINWLFEVFSSFNAIACNFCITLRIWNRLFFTYSWWFHTRIFPLLIISFSIAFASLTWFVIPYCCCSSTFSPIFHPISFNTPSECYPPPPSWQSHFYFFAPNFLLLP